jgi:hypothetical protein
MSLAQLKHWIIEYRLELVVYICALTAITYLLSSCEFFKNHTNPVAGWQEDFKGEPSQVVQKDAQDYISKLPGMEKNWVGPQSWLTDGKAQHALVITVAVNGTDWGHVLIYDKNDRRVKVVKYVMGHYAC